jgi:UDP-2,3-diacylglucosamine pyrophosphatase LpxH
METTFIAEDRFCLTGDTHLGNPFFGQSNAFLSFIDYLSENNFNLCINGDGIDILQLSMAGISIDLPAIIERIELMVSRGLKVYYIIGNHDIYLEKFFHKWKNFIMIPFLDVVSGDKRIHIEHGHLYDDFFINHPTLYTRLTIVGGYLLKVCPRLYKIWDKAYSWLLGVPARMKHSCQEPIDKPQLIEGAKTLLQRGYDVVIFGHSHYVAQLTMEEGGQYFNTGSWLRYPNHFIEIQKGVPELKIWK